MFTKRSAVKLPSATYPLPMENQILDTLVRIETRLQGIETKLEQHDQRFDTVDERFDAIDERFEQVDRRLDENSRAFQETNEFLTQELNLVYARMDRRFGEAMTHMSVVTEQIRSDFRVYREESKGLPQRVDDHEARIVTLERTA